MGDSIWSAVGQLVGGILPAGSEGLLAARFREVFSNLWREPGPGSIVWFVVTIVSGFCIALAGLALYRRSQRRLVEPPSAEEDTERTLRQLGIEGVTAETLAQVAGMVEEPVERCIQSVEVFDTGAERLVARAGLWPATERLEVLRNLRTLRKKLGFHRVQPQEPLKSTRCLPVDQELLVLVPGARGGEHCFVSAVFHVEEESILLRLKPAAEQPAGVPFPAGAGARVRIQFFRSNEGSYSFESTLLEFRERGPGFLRIRHARSLRRKQRRNYLRMELHERVRFRWFPRRGAAERNVLYGDLDEILREHEGVALDLSGGGVKISVPDLALEFDDWVEIRFPFLPGSLADLCCFARVVQVYSPAPHGVWGLSLESPPARLEAGILREVERRYREANGLGEAERAPCENPAYSPAGRTSRNRTHSEVSRRSRG